MSFAVGFTKKAGMFRDLAKGSQHSIRNDLAGQIRTARRYLKKHPGAPAREAAVFTGPQTTDIITVRVPKKGTPK